MVPRIPEIDCIKVIRSIEIYDIHVLPTEFATAMIMIIPHRYKSIVAFIFSMILKEGIKCCHYTKLRLTCGKYT